MHHCYSYTHTCIQTYNMTDAADYEELDFPPPPKPPHTRYSHTQLPNESSSQPVAPPRTTSRYVERDRKVSGWALHVNDNGTSLYTCILLSSLWRYALTCNHYCEDLVRQEPVNCLTCNLCLYSLTSHCGFSLCSDDKPAPPPPASKPAKRPLPPPKPRTYEALDQEDRPSIATAVKMVGLLIMILCVNLRFNVCLHGCLVGLLANRSPV